MLFSSPLFLFLYLPAVLLLYRLLPLPRRNGFLLAASLFFYAWGEPRFVLVALLSAALDWLLGGRIRRTDDPRVRRSIVAIGVIANLAVLVYFKYTGFLLSSLNSVLAPAGWAVPVFQVALPIGVSFVVFEKITYLVDLYRGTGVGAARFVDYLLYVLFFPKLLAGPIIKYHDIEPYLNNRVVTAEDLPEGLRRFSLGLAKKVLIADTLGRFVDAAFRAPSADWGTRTAWLAILGYSLQIYFDFSGYSDMAIGLGRMFGFRLLENFNTPYLSATFTEFWRRWHISLSSWIREYLYIPLGGSRVSRRRGYFNLCLCFLLSGLWHGASWAFVLWGLFHGVFLVLDRLLGGNWARRFPRPLTAGVTFLLVTLGWVLFRSPSLGYALHVYQALAGAGSAEPAFVRLGGDVAVTAVVAAGIVFAPLLAPLWKRLRLDFHYQAHGAITAAFSLGLLLLSGAKVATSTFSPFLYFRF